VPTVFDTIAAVRRLEDAGLSREAAEAIAAGNLEAVDAARDAAFSDRGALATKADLAPLATKAELATLATKAELAPLATKAELATLATKAELSEFEARITWRIVGLLIASNALLVAAVKLIP